MDRIKKIKAAVEYAATGGSVNEPRVDLRRLIEALLGDMTHAPFNEGDRVKTIKGAHFRGLVVSVYLLPDYRASDEKGWRVDVLATNPEFEGTLHVYPAVQLALDGAR